MLRGKGFTLIELLIAMVIFGILALLMAMAVESASRSRKLQKALSVLEQDTAIAAQLLQEEIAQAGYRGDFGKDTFGCFDLGSNSEQCQWADDEKTKALSWIGEHWSLLRYEDGSMPSTLSVVDDQNHGDVLTIRNLSPIDDEDSKYPAIFKDDSNGWPYVHYGIQEISYKLGNSAGISGKTLKRERDTYLCPKLDGVDITQDTAQNVQCNNTSDGNAQPVISLSVDDFQVYFLKKDGTWQKDLPSASDTAAVGIYLRTAYTSPVGPKRCGPWPSPKARALLPEDPSALGISSKTYTGAECKRLRLERVLTVYLTNPQVW